MRDPGLPPYRNLDAEGASQAAAERLEARALTAASEDLFLELVSPLLASSPSTVLDVGCGTAWLSRRIARALPRSRVYATDKSEGMVAFARERIAAGPPRSLQVATWDVTDAKAFPFEEP